MTKTCREFDAARRRWVDGEAAPAEALGLRLHLASCPVCEEDVRQQREVREALRLRAAELRGLEPRASEDLRRRVAAIVADAAPATSAPQAPTLAATTTHSGRALRRSVWQWLPRTAAAAVLLAVTGVVLTGALAPRGGILAAQLALDHLKCLVIATTSPGADPAVIGREWRERGGWDIEVPPSAEAIGLRLVGLRTCLYHEGQMAHVLYDVHGERVSLFVMPQHGRAGAELDVLGQHTRTWSRGGRTYALVAAGDPGPLEAVAAHFEAHAR